MARPQIVQNADGSFHTLDHDNEGRPTCRYTPNGAAFADKEGRVRAKFLITDDAVSTANVPVADKSKIVGKVLGVIKSALRDPAVVEALITLASKALPKKR